MSTSDELIRLTAREAVDLLKKGDVTPLELIDAAVLRIEAVDPAVNAIPTRCIDRARTHARKIMAGGTANAESTWLAGLPVVIKDLSDVAGVRTTYGSPIYAEYVPDRSAIEVEMLERRGAIVIGKSNTPEFGAGAQTFNEVFGRTLNPWNTALTCGGSSGGSAVALATGMAWLAHGSDMGGSLRIPAAFCGVVGMRPSPGRVGHGPGSVPFQTLSVDGPMARNVRDLAMMLDALSGYHPADPLTYAAPAVPYLQASGGRPQLRRIAFSPNLGGITPVDPEIAAICRAAAERFAELGAAVDEGCMDLSNAVECFTVLRAEQFVAQRAPLLGTHREKLKPEVVWNIESGMQLTADRIGWAQRERGRIFASTVEFFETYDLLACPATILPPFDVNLRYIDEFRGYKFPSYIDWATINHALTLTACPTISIPCGFTGSGLPVGLQIMARPRGEATLLAAAARLEDVLDLGAITPIDPRSPA